MATKCEEYERRFLAAVTDATEVIEDHGDHTIGQWPPRLACEALAREVAAALAELAPAEQTEVEAVTCERCGGPFVRVKNFDGEEELHHNCDGPVWDASKVQPATPPASAPTGEVMPRLGAARADQREAVEAACAPLREEIARLEKLRDELAKAAAGYKMLYEGSLDETFKRMCDKSEAEKRIDELEAELGAKHAKLVEVADKKRALEGELARAREPLTAAEKHGVHQRWVAGGGTCELLIEMAAEAQRAKGGAK